MGEVREYLASLAPAQYMHASIISLFIKILASDFTAFLYAWSDFNTMVLGTIVCQIKT